MFKKSFFTAIFIFLIFMVGNGLDRSLQNKVYAYTETTYFIHQDNLGSVVAVTNDATVSAQMDYSSYGEVSSQQSADCRSNPNSVYCNLPSANSLVTERSYTGQIQDASTSLSYYNARYYDPILSRFISADQVQGGNRYAYVGGNPISRNDPTGNKMSYEDGGGGGYTPPINTYTPYDNVKTPYQYATNYANDENMLSRVNNQGTPGATRYTAVLIERFATTKDPLEFAVTGLELFTFGGISSLNNAWDKWVYDNKMLNTIGNYDFGTRFNVSTNLGVSATMMSLSVTSALKIKMPEWNLGNSIKNAKYNIASKLSSLDETAVNVGYTKSAQTGLMIREEHNYSSMIKGDFKSALRNSGDPVDAASVISGDAMRNTSDLARMKSFGWARPRNAWETAVYGRSNCIDVCQVVTQLLGEQGIDAVPINFSNNIIPHYAVSIPSTGQVIMPGGRITSIKALMRMLGK